MLDRKTNPGARRGNVGGRIPTHGRAPTFSPGLLEMRVLARIDGVLTVAAIAHDLELAPNEAMAVLERLERIGAVRWLDVVDLAPDELDEVDELDADAEPDRITSPDGAFERPTWPGAPSTLR